MRWLLTGLSLVTGCASGDRCAEIQAQSAVYEEYAATERRVEAEMRSHPDYAAWFAHDTARTRMRREVRLRLSGDSVEPSPAIPPRPSDVAWYAEQCWQGQAR